jgi:hypothetical protein
MPFAYSLSHISSKFRSSVDAEAERLDMHAIRPGAKQDLANKFILISSTIINWSLAADMFNDL